MPSERLRGVICDGPSCAQTNSGLKQELPALALSEGEVCEIGTRNMCNGICQKDRANVIVKSGNTPLIGIRKAAERLPDDSIATHSGEIVTLLKYLNSQPANNPPKVA